MDWLVFWFDDCFVGFGDWHGTCVRKSVMPNQSPVSRYLLVGIAALMLGSALPDLDVLVAQVKHLRQGDGVRTVTTTVVVDGVKSVRTFVERPGR